MVAERSQEEVAGGFLRCRVGTSTLDMPTLKMKDERAWRTLLASTFERLAETEVGEADFRDFGNPATLKAAATLIQFPAEAVLDLVLAYDKTNALGGRDALESAADSAQVWAIFQRALLVVFPFVTSLGSLLAEMMQTGTSPTTPGSSLMNGLWPTGTPAPTN